MAEISREATFAKLSPTALSGLESALALCRMRGNPRVELAHWFHQMFQLPDSDLFLLADRLRLDAGRLAADLTRTLDGLPRAATSFTAISPQADRLVREAWLYASLMFDAPAVRSGHLLVAALQTADLRPVALAMSRELEAVKPAALADGFDKLTAGSAEAPPATPEAGPSAARPGRAAEPPPSPVGVGGRPSALARFTDDLTAKARDGRLDPVLGRDAEVRQVIDILMRRRQNNPILTGEAGVGKTAVVEGFAARVAAGDVPEALRDVSVRALDLGLLSAGAGVKGEFEQRLRDLVDEVQASPRPIVLFIDEAHTLIGAGGAAGSGDAANLLKPALARGTLRTVAATTWAEYKRHIDKDPALVRRFEVVNVEQPTEAAAVRMLRGIAAAQERHHKVHVRNEALVAAVRLSNRYVPARQLPDKAVSLLDTACARVAVGLDATPADVADARDRLSALRAELDVLARETALGVDHAERRAEAAAEVAAEEQRLAQLEARWTAERDLVTEIRDLRSQLAEPAAGDGSSAALERLRSAEAKLAVVQGDRPLVLPTVDARAVAAVVADWTGIPVGRMVADEVSAVLNLADMLGQRVVGQRHALDTIARRIQTSRAGLDNPDRPVGVFLLAGPSGVGKTETAHALADALYGGGLITINMSEFQESHTVSTLKGSPPGYVGYGEGGVLTEAVRRRPYSVVLLDEVEKAHPDVHELFFQVFDKGTMEDGEGRRIDFRNTIILLTSNAGTEPLMRACQDGKLRPPPEELSAALRRPLLDVFPPALLGRLVVVPYYPIGDEMIDRIIRLQLGKVERRLRDGHKATFTYTDDVVRLIAARCTETGSGARAVDAIVTHTILPEVSRQLLGRATREEAIGRVTVATERGEFAVGVE